MVWPTPTGQAAEHARMQVQSVAPSLCYNVTEEAADRVEAWVWHVVFQGRAAISVLVLAMGMLASSIFPEEGPVRRRGPSSGLCATILCALGVMRLRAAMQLKRPPRWAARMMRILAPGWLAAASHADTPAVQYLRAACRGSPPCMASCIGPAHPEAVVYILGCHAGVYVGKANVCRAGQPGYPARVFEHLRALIRPLGAEGGKPRYHLLRRSLGSTVMMPAIASASEARAFSLEACAIRLEAPAGNVLETIAHGYATGRGKAARIRSTPRKRPSSWLRSRQKPWASIWGQQWVSAIVDRRQAPPYPELTGAKGVDLPFRELYTLQQREEHGLSGRAGPLWLFCRERIMLFVAYMASRCKPIVRPRSWARWEMAAFLYHAVRVCDVMVTVQSRKYAARKNIGFFLSQLRLPLTVPVFVIPGVLSSLRVRGSVQAALAAVLEGIPCGPARRWMREHFRVRFGRTELWAHKVNASATFRRAHVHAEPHPPGCPLPFPICLQALGGEWRLPRWPDAEAVSRALCREWMAWTGRLHMPSAIRHRGSRVLLTRAAAFRIPARPPLWQGQETHLQQQLRRVRGQVLAADDRRPDRIWAGDRGQLMAYYLAAADADPGWHRQPQLTDADGRAWQWARAQAGLPVFLRPRAPSLGSTRSQDLSMPHSFPLIKSKCVAPDGVHTCRKLGHSCFRRVVDASQLLAKRGWKAVSRGARGVLRVACVSREVWDMRCARAELDAMMADLRAPATRDCCRCGRGLGGQLQLVIADADQAFEACAADRLRQDWSDVMAQYRLRTGTTDILVRRGRADVFRAGRAGFGRGWWRFTLDHLTRSILVFTALTLVSVCGHIYEMDGIPIGGLMSGVCVSVTLGAQEWRWQRDSAAHLREGFCFGASDALSFISWKRYVDDLIAISRCYCCACVYHFLQCAFTVKLSPVTDLSSSSAGRGTWLDLDVSVHGQALCVIPKNVNRPWLYRGEPRERCTLGRWPGRPPKGFGNLRSLFLVRVARARDLQLPAALAAVWLGELTLEMFLLGYPVSILRALVHSLPCSLAAQAARRLIRAFGAILRDSAAMNDHHRSKLTNQAGPGKRPTRGAEGDDWGKARGGDRAPTGRRHGGHRASRRSRSTTSSSSSASGGVTRKGKRLRKAQAHLYAHDPAYRAWKEETAAKAQEEALRKQGRVLAEALGDKLDNIVSATASAASAAAAAAARASPQGMPPPAAPVSAAAGAGPQAASAAPARGEGEGVNALQCKWLSAELGHKVSLVPGERAAVKKAIMAKQTDRNMNNAIVGFLRKYTPGVRAPRSFADKVDAVLSCVQDQ